MFVSQISRSTRLMPDRLWAFHQFRGLADTSQRRVSTPRYQTKSRKQKQTAVHASPSLELHPPASGIAIASQHCLLPDCCSREPRADGHPLNTGWALPDPSSLDAAMSQRARQADGRQQAAAALAAAGSGGAPAPDGPPPARAGSYRPPNASMRAKHRVAPAYTADRCAGRAGQTAGWLPSLPPFRVPRHPLSLQSQRGWCPTHTRAP